MPLAEAVKRAGSFAALLPHLCAGSILTRRNGFYSWPGGQARGGPGNIPPSWWVKAREDATSGRVIFSFAGWSDSPSVPRELFAAGVEVERAAVERLFPVATVPAPRHAGGRDPDNDWEGATRHVDDWVTAHGPLPRRKDGEPNVARAVELMTEWFNDNEPPAPKRESIYRWLRDNPHPAWWL
jgi:hypothetical protein